MAHYKINSTTTSDGSHRLLIGLPLLVISVFCFGLVLMHPNNGSVGQATATAHSAPYTTSTKLPSISSATDNPAPAKLTPAPDNTTPTSATSNDLSAVSSTSSTPVTTSPQLSTTGTASLQAASPNTSKAGTGNSKTPVIKQPSTVKAAIKALITQVVH